MGVIKTIFVHFIFINIIILTEGLVELPSVEDNNIQVAEAAIRNTINALFSKLKFKGNKHSPKLKQYSTIHNYFVTLTLKDHYNLKELAKLTRVDNKNFDNGTVNLMAVLNELLNEDNDRTGEVNNELNTNEDNFINYVVNFLSNLKYLKETYNVYNHVPNVDVNADILKILQREDNLKLNKTSDGNQIILDSIKNGSVLNENEFWQPSGRRIYRGERTKIKHFPFMASIQIFHKFQCGGSIIKSDLIITAASCLQLAWNNRFFRENPAFLSVRVGSNFYHGGGEDISVLEIYFNPEYNPKNLRNNLALLRLTRWLKFRKKARKIKKIDIDRHPSPLSMNVDGITIVGWGARRESNIIGDPWSNRLAFSVLDVYPLRDCQEIYSSEYVTKKHFCAGFLSKGGGACNRDVGGPGIVHGILGGVISFGSPVCGTPDAPTVFTKLGYYSDWIDKIMEQDVPRIKIKTTLKPPFSFNYPQSYTTQRPTTFKIAPIGSGKMKPIPINRETALRFDGDDNLFQEFISAMFGSKEMKDIQDIISEEEQALNKNQPELKNIIRQPVVGTVLEEVETLKGMHGKPVTESVGFTTKMSDYDFNNEITKANTDFTLMTEDKDLDAAIDIVPGNDDTEEIVKTVSSESEEMKFLKNKNNDKIKKRWNKLNDSVLTLLYLSDNETLNENKLVDNDQSEGISIDLDAFKDVTFKSNDDNADFFDFLSKDELYDLLSEAIDINTNNKDIESLWLFLNIMSLNKC